MIFGPDGEHEMVDAAGDLGARMRAGYDAQARAVEAEPRTPIDWGAAPEDVDPNEDGIGYE